MSKTEQNTQVEITSTGINSMKAIIPKDLIPDLPVGPLDKYRKQASFNWKRLKFALEDEESILLKNKVWKTIESEPVFQHVSTALSSDEEKRRAAKQLVRLHALKYTFIPEQVLKCSYKRKTRLMMTMNEALAVYSRALSVKFALGVSLFSNALLSLGTERHLELCDAAWRGDVLSCFAITEIAHGSNTKKLRTVATYDPRTEQFVIHTPDFEAAKCWIGNLGKTCTHAIVFAQLKTSDGENHGLHAFIVPIRDLRSLSPYPGVVVGDMGEKIGVHGIDNGFIMFDHYRVPKTNLLNKTGDVNEEGCYESSFSNPQQILGAALENLSAGRVAITQECVNTLCCAVTIAIRYAALRVQFGPSDEKEVSLLEYPLHQWRIFPYVAATCVFKVFIADFTDQYLEAVERSNSSTTKIRDLSVMVSEIHAIVSSCKPLVSWTCRDAIQESREACGGHGFLKASGIGDLRNDHDPTVTYEGDNNVLIQQTSNFLLRNWGHSDTPVSERSPLGSINFLKDVDSILSFTFIGDKIEDVVNHKFVTSTYQWLLCWLMKETSSKMNELQKSGLDRFSARSHCQIYKARTLSLVFAENNALIYFWRRVNASYLSADLRVVLEKLYFIYGLWCIDKHLTYLYQGGFASGPHLASLVRTALITLCADMKSEVVGVIDAIAPPDFALNSVLGKSDGQLYDNLKKVLLQPGATDRAEWWKEVVPSVSSKL